MKILIDENLSPKLARKLSDLLPEMQHVRELGHRSSPDTTIWNIAAQHGFAAILTADIDFQNIVIEHGHPPKVIRIANCNFTNAETSALLRREAIRILEFLNSPNALLVLRR